MYLAWLSRTLGCQLPRMDFSPSTLLLPPGVHGDVHGLARREGEASRQAGDRPVVAGHGELSRWVVGIRALPWSPVPQCHSQGARQAWAAFLASPPGSWVRGVTPLSEPHFCCLKSGLDDSRAHLRAAGRSEEKRACKAFG